MADDLISSLTATAALAESDLLEVEQGTAPTNTSGKVTLAQLRDYVQRKRPVTALTISSGVVNIDLSLGQDFTCLLDSNVTSVTFSNLPGAGYVAEIDVTWQQDGTGGRTVVLPASFKALGGSDTAVASAANAATEMGAKSKDNGTTWRYAMQESA